MKTGQEILEENFKLQEEKKELLTDIKELIFYIQNITGGDFESCAVYEIFKKYEQ